MCDLDVMGAPSKLSVIRKDAALARARPALLRTVEKSLFFVLLHGTPIDLSMYLTEGLYASLLTITDTMSVRELGHD